MEEKSLSLIVKEKTLGILVTNARDIKKFVENKIATYNVDNYDGDDKQAAKDKAELNNAAKQLNQERITLEKEWLEPFDEFKSIVSETVGLIQTASSKLDVIVKAKEAQEKEAKKQSIQEIWDIENFNLVSLDRVFNQKWLNKGTKISTIEADIKEEIKTITNDINALESFGEDSSHLKEIYLTTLDLQKTLQKGAELKANREKLEAMRIEQERKAQEELAAKEEKQVVETPITEQTPVNTEQAEPQTEQVEAPTETTQNVRYTFNIVGNEPSLKLINKLADSIGIDYKPSITMEGTKGQLQQLGNEFTKHGIVYDKNNFLTLCVR